MWNLFFCKGRKFVFVLLRQTGIHLDVFPHCYYRHHYLDTHTRCRGSIFHFNSTIKHHWSVTTEAQPFCIFNVFPACTVSVAIKLHPNALRVEDGWHHCSTISSVLLKSPLFTLQGTGIRWKKGWQQASTSQYKQHNSNARVMVAVSVRESESLKMQDPFKQYVKLSRLKIYVPWVHEGLRLLLLFSLCNNEGGKFVESRREKAHTQN